MNIIDSDKKLVNDLFELEHPLKDASYELIFSDYIYYLTCKKNKYKHLSIYR